MAMVAPAAEAVAKKTAKHVAEKKAKSQIAQKAKAKAKAAGNQAVTKAKDGAKKSYKKASKSRLSPKFMPAPVSYNVRKQHNLVMGMWLATNFVYIFSYYNSDGKITIAELTKRLVAINFAFFIVSILALSETFARAVGAFGVLIFMGVAFANQNYIINGMKGIAQGGLVPPKVGTLAPTPEDKGSFNGGVTGSF